MDKKKLYDILDKSISEESNFFATIVTEFHLTGVLSYSETLLKEGIKLKGHICIIEHPTNGYLLEERYLEKYNLHLVHSRKGFELPKIAEIGNFFYKFLLNKKEKDNFYLINVLYPHHVLLIKCLLNKNFTKKLKIICVDEGIGSYMPTKYLDNMAKLESKNYKKTNTLIKIVKKIILLPFLPIENRFIYEFDNTDKMKTNYKISNDYLSFYEHQYLKVFPLSSNAKSSIDIINKNRKSTLAIYFSQPLVEYGLLSPYQQKKILKELESNLSKNDTLLLIKPHPRENYDIFKELDIDIIDINLPAEIVANILKPDFVIGVSTTSLATISTLFNIPSYSLISIIEKEFNTSSILIQSMNIYKLKFNEYINFIKNYDEFSMKTNAHKKIN